MLCKSDHQWCEKRPTWEVPVASQHLSKPSSIVVLLGNLGNPRAVLDCSLSAVGYEHIAVAHLGYHGVVMLVPTTHMPPFRVSPRPPSHPPGSSPLYPAATPMVPPLCWLMSVVVAASLSWRHCPSRLMPSTALCWRWTRCPAPCCLLTPPSNSSV